MSRPALVPPRATHNCGRCGTGVFSARWRLGGLLVHVEPNAARGNLEVVPELPGLRRESLPHVELATRGKITAYREHVYPNVKRRGPAGADRPIKPERAFSAASFKRKRRA